jgi:cytochrome b subunit of formate dehydrogenase
MATHQNVSRTGATQAAIVRFSLFQRLEHILLIGSFSLLALTGLVQKFAGNPVAEWLIGALGGIETVRTIHHVAAIVFALEGIYHFIVLAHKVYVKRVEMTMLPGLRDLTDALDAIRYNLGLSHEHPRLPRYNFAEKAEYWAMLWGFFLMGLTGLILWNPITFSNILPGQFIPAAKAAHGAEAILAVLAILVWHIYNVHIKMFNKSMFTGKMSRRQMEEEHGEELVRLEAGEMRTPPSPEGIRKRERIFIPVAVVGALVAVIALYFFVSYETTAIATVPPAETGPVFVPLTPTPAPSPTGATQVLGAPIPHPVEGQEQCDACHGPDGVKPQPADHEGRPVESCLICHQPGAAAEPGTETTPGAGGAPGAIPHAVEGREQCDLCHGAEGSLSPLPASHEGRQVETCQLCHKPAGSEAVSEGGMPNPVPHSITEAAYQDCTMCHGEGKVKPSPENHAGFTADSCTTCHQPAAGGAAPEAGATSEPEAGGGMATPKAIPHSITDAAYQDCTPCHGVGMIRPAPENHAGFAADSCTSCHQPAAGGAAPEAGATSEPEASGGMATPNAIPHSITDAAYQDCTTCHGAGMMKPAPENHAGFAADSCTTCHQPAAGGATPEVGATSEPEASGGIATPKAIPHSITEAAYQDCTLCHGAGKLKPSPASHAGFTTDSCTTCHQPAQ